MDRYDVTNTVDGGTQRTVIQVGRVGSMTVQATPAPADPAPPGDPWARAVLDSGVWAHTAPRDAEPHRRHAVRLAERLAAVRDGAEQRIAGDPWADPGFAARFADRVEWLLGEPDGALDLYPAEAGLLVLLPYLYQTHQLLLVASRLDADPTDLRLRHGATGWRAGYQSFLAGHDLLVNRAALRPQAAPATGWWLYRRWLAEEDTGVDRLADLAAALAPELAAGSGPLAEALNVRRLARILTGLRIGADVCNPEHLGQLEADELLPGPGRQRVRERRACLLLAVAYGAAVEPAVLPDTVVEHTGVPNPVDLDGLRRTVAATPCGCSPSTRSRCPSPWTRRCRSPNSSASPAASTCPSRRRPATCATSASTSATWRPPCGRPWHGCRSRERQDASPDRFGPGRTCSARVDGRAWIGCAVMGDDWRDDRIGSALGGLNPTVLRRLDAGFAVIGDVQFLPGYSVLLVDEPDVQRLSELPRDKRMAFLADMDRLGEAVERVCRRLDPEFRRVNLEILGNTDNFLHAHVWPRFGWESPHLVGHPVWRYPAENWRDPANALGPGHDALREAIGQELDVLSGAAGTG